jgi:hypothetical protein
MAHASQTMELGQTRMVNPSRTHDHIYDPVFTTGSRGSRPAASNVQMANTVHSVERVPAYNNMFSDNPNFPRHLFRMKAERGGSKNVSAQKTSSAMSGVMSGQAGPVMAVPLEGAQGAQGATGKSLSQLSSAHEVVGRSRLKFFARPKLPFLQAVPAQVLLAPNVTDQQKQIEQEQKQLMDEEMNSKQNIGVQSVFRESSAQTDPYTRDYITAEGEPEPEILSIAHLSYGNGLPASLDEINLIHRMREKRAFEQSLPPVTDEASFKLRKRMLEERELKEWHLREDEMKHEQDEKLQLLIDTLRDRENKKTALGDARVELVRQEKIAKRDRTFAKIHADRIKVHRSLAKSRVTYGEKKITKRDIISEHSSCSSKVYAPNTRDGRIAVKNQVVDYGIPLISNYQGLAALEDKIAHKALRAQVKAPEKIILKHEQTRKGMKILADLAYCDQLLDSSKAEKVEKRIENVYKKFEPVMRAITPSVEVPEFDDAERAILLLQRFLRGRAVQNEMFKGKERSLQLIRELRLDENPVQEKPADADISMKNAADTLQGEVVSKTLDFLTKEILRVAEERRVAALVDVATQQRRIREAEEAGRRQAEDLRRKKREQQYAELMEENSRSSERFLDELFGNAVATVAHNAADHQASVKAANVDPLVAHIEDENNTAEVVVTDLVSSFLFPEAERRRVQNAKQTRDRAYLDSAHSVTLHNVISEVGDESKR